MGLGAVPGTVPSRPSNPPCFGRALDTVIMKIRVIVNPKAGAGSAGRKVPELTQAFRARGVTYEVEETRMPGDATGLSRKARVDGVDLIAVVGGDGTLNEVSRA